MNGHEPWLWDERPYAPDGFVPVWMWFDGESAHPDQLLPHELTRPVFERLTAGTDAAYMFARTYPTRGEALQDLAQAMQGVA